MPTPPKWRVIASFTAVYLIWGSSYLAIHFAIESLPPFLIAGIRFTIAGLILFALARRGGAPNPGFKQWRSAMLLGILMFLVANGCLMWAQKTVPSGIAATLYATVPLWFALLGWLWLGENRPSGRVMIGLLVGFAGTALLVGPAGEIGSVDPFGAFLVLVSAAAWAISSLLSRQLHLSDSPMMVAAMNLFTGGLLLLGASLVTGEWATLDLGAIDPRSLLAVGYLILGPSVTAFSSYMWLLANVSPSSLGTYAYVNPVVAVFLGWLLAGELLTPRTIIASGVIIAAVVLITTARKAKASPTVEHQGISFWSHLRTIWQER